MLIKAILVGLVLGLCKSEWIYGFPQVGRPIVVSTLTGLFLGDPVQGVIMGSVLELMFIGSFPIGAAVSPDYTSAGAICTAFAILTGGGKAVATAMAFSDEPGRLHFPEKWLRCNGIGCTESGYD